MKGLTHTAICYWNRMGKIVKGMEDAGELALGFKAKASVWSFHDAVDQGA